MTRIIYVNSLDIQDGKRGCGDMCPISLALQRHGYQLPFTAHRWISYYEGTEKKYRYMEGKLVQFVSDFDNGRKVEPFSFEL